MPDRQSRATQRAARGERARTQCRVILDGGRAAELPDGSGGLSLVGTQAVFIRGRADVDVPTLVRSEPK